MLKFLKVFGVLVFILVLVIFIFMQQASFGKLPSGDQLSRIKKSNHYNGGKFHNVVETRTMAEGASYFKLTREFFRKDPSREPTSPLPSVKTDLTKLSDENTSIVWFGHSSYLLRIENRNILVDPVFSERASPVQWFGSKSFPGSQVYSAGDLPQLNAVIITHDHYDHLDHAAIVQLKDAVPVFFVPLGVGAHLLHWGVAKEKVVEFDWWQEETVLTDFKLIATPARHFSGRGLQRDKTLWTSYVLKTGAQSIFIGGDSGYDNSFKAIGAKYGPFDLALLECGQYDLMWPTIHMMPEETVQASVDLGAQLLMPIHWGKFSLGLHPWREPIQRLTKEAGIRQVKVTTPRIGEPVILGVSAPATAWWE